VTVTTLGPGRRMGALMALKLASLVLRGGTSLYQRRAIPRSTLRVMLTASQMLERAGMLFAFGRRRSSRKLPTNKDWDNDRIN
jgi:hypothetical protein